MSSSTRWRVAFSALVTTALVITGAGVATATPTSAHRPASTVQPASSWCVYPFCSETDNESLGSILVAHDWCGNAERLSQEAPPCGSSDDNYWLTSGESTDPYQDWDTFRVDDGCVVEFHINYTGGEQTVNRQGRGSQWIRIHDDQTAFIDYGSCW